jgi:glycosyltransferase involved in cell wall biosynthesis
MKIAIDIRDAASEKTGKGWYVYNIVKEVLKLDKKNNYLLYGNQKKNPLKDYGNGEYKFIDAKPSRWHFLVLKDIQKEKVDVFFAPSSFIIPALAPKTIKTVITVHDLVSYLFPANHNAKAVIIERLTLKRALKRANSVFVVSENTKKDLLKKFKYPENRIFITHCAASDFFKTQIEQKEIEKFRAKMKYPEKFILAVGTLEPRKNFSTLIRSFSTIKKWYPDYKLIIVGKKGWKFRQIEETLKKYKLENDVLFPGYLKDSELKNTYKLATVFVFPSLYEGFGIPPLEAMASGCPVVCSNVASMPEVVGEAGFLVDPNNPYQFADAVSSLIENEQVRSSMIERGYRQTEKFNWKVSAEKVLEVFNNIADVKEA